MGLINMADETLLNVDVEVVWLRGFPRSVSYVHVLQEENTIDQVSESLVGRRLGERGTGKDDIEYSKLITKPRARGAVSEIGGDNVEAAKVLVRGDR
jgi:hypothetical protein